jgi:hypothetical protein
MADDVRIICFVVNRYAPEITFIRYAPEITFIRYAPSQKIGDPNNIKIFGCKN